MSGPQNSVAALVGDTNTNKLENPFHLHFSGAFRLWLAQEGISLVFTTYEGGKLIIIGPGQDGRTIVTERKFDRCMALCTDNDRAIWISTKSYVWKLENGLDTGCHHEDWDRIYLPRLAHVTGGVDLHELTLAPDGTLYGVITMYNCVARISMNERGGFSPYWKPPFINGIFAEDRCHLNGLCLDEAGMPAYVSMVAPSNTKDGWRQQRKSGGQIMDMRSDEIIVSGLSMPHTPRLYQGALWFLEAGSGYICRLCPQSGKTERLIWRPGFLRGLSFYKHYALVCSSAPRDKIFEGIPLQDALDKQSLTARCAIDIIDTISCELVHSIEISGSVKEIYDVSLLENCRQPLLYGILGEDSQNIIVLGPDETQQGPLNSRKKS